MRSRLLALLAAAPVLLAGCGFSGLYGTHLPGGADVGSHPYTVTIYFTNVLDLVPQSAVKVNDVAVGRVEDVALSKPGDDSGQKSTNGWTARVTITVNSDVQLPENARATIKQTTLLGEKYVDLEQPLDAPSSTRLTDGDTIPVTRTGSAPETEEVLGALSLLLNGGGLPQIRIITTELNKALDGNQGAVRDLLGQLNSFVGSLDKQKSDIITAVDSVDRLARTLDVNRAKIATALDRFPQALKILKDDRSRLTGLLTSLSRLGGVATRVVTETQQNLVGSLKSLAPALEQLTASGSDLVNALKIGGTFPFPLGTTLQAVRGDYANLHLFLDLNLTNELCGLNRALCDAVKGAQPNSAATRALPQPNAVSEPTLIGTGG